MKKVKLVAREKFPYARRDLVAGDEFDAASAEDARILVLVGRAKYPDKEAKPEADRDAAAKRYSRRDLRAEN